MLRSEWPSVPGVFVKSNKHTALQNYGVLLKQPKKLGLKIVTVSFMYLGIKCKFMLSPLLKSGEISDDLVTFGG